ncbi:hypothetical protein [Granulicella tundricola]|uniref:RNA polymerase sigma-70 region 4 domain-containing protein n=1 Tax=Granulicella tundricola (strain ATCC BAA-1859 / DSM 23138 / MP5ACTX9) TaxID=1198114 RepID=E8X462_GRATM|nr:hypothetical protein [Granulicella tundricola]ADW67122.1 hypothetical protein AciX9_0031 [Granulicella tundricola MP5ACTX9]
MSAALVILPVIQAMAEVASRPAAGPISATGAALRKGPHRLTLVRASAAVLPDAEERIRLRPSPELSFYRKYTEAMLKRYTKLSMEAGRAPSLLGRELFRGHVTNYKVSSFDDVVIYVHDVENCVAKLGRGQQYLVRKIAMQGYTQQETAAMIGTNLKIVIKRYVEAIDLLTRLFLDLGLLAPTVASKRVTEGQ